jgi:heterodisulfide reductase subunit D
MNNDKSTENELPHKQYFELCAGCGICNDDCTVNLKASEQTITSSNPQKMAKHLLKLGRDFESAETEKPNNESGEFVPDPYICTGCGRCSHVCPYFVPFLDNLVEAKNWARSLGLESPPQNIIELENNIISQGNPFGNPKDRRDEWIRDDFPELDEAEVVYFPGCTTAYQLFGIETAIFKVLKASGVTTTYLGKDEGCCGRPFYFAGREEDMNQVAGFNVKSVLKKSAKALLVNCPSCYLAFKRHYPPIVGKLPFKVFHITEYIHKLIGEKRLTFSKTLDKSMIYHDPCELGRICGVFDEPREVLKALPGVKLLEFDKTHSDGLCCGGGGLFEAVDEKQSFSIGETVVLEALHKEADILATACPTCNSVFNMAKDNLIRKTDSKIRIKISDVAEIVLKCI